MNPNLHNMPMDFASGESCALFAFEIMTWRMTSMASKLESSVSSASSTMTPSPSADNALSAQLSFLLDLMYSASEMAIVGASMRNSLHSRWNFAAEVLLMKE